ncbi:MAG: DUF4433 domain-containing protein [Candidatus Omnitrophica bacterium]|nr:DUF4433 domain-containing protein [Candidatus Omnitrophota bacterium]
MTPEQRQELMRLLGSGEEISPEWARILFPPEKREYELVYHGKDREEDIIADTLAVPLQPVRTFGRNGVDWHNMLIFGDNLQVMKTLLEMKKSGQLCNADGTPGVRLIYIDPPFATQQEFKGTEDQKAYQDKIAGAQFVEFLRKRLVFLREILADNGSIYVHLDTRKSHYLKTILDELFDEGRFENEIIWKRSSAHSDSSTFANLHDTLLFYTCSPSSIFNPHFKAYSDEYREEIYASFWLDDDYWEQERRKGIKCAEILVPERVEPRYIIGAYVANQTALDAFKRISDLPVEIKGSLFF